MYLTIICYHWTHAYDLIVWALSSVCVCNHYGFKGHRSQYDCMCMEERAWGRGYFHYIHLRILDPPFAVVYITLYYTLCHGVPSDMQSVFNSDLVCTTANPGLRWLVVIGRQRRWACKADQSVFLTTTAPVQPPCSLVQ